MPAALSRIASVCGSVIVLAALLTSNTPVLADDTTLVDFTPDFTVDSIEKRDADVKLTTDTAGRTWLQLDTGNSYRWPGITIPAPESGWDFSNNAQLSLDICNMGDEAVSVSCRIDTTTNSGGEQTIRKEIAPGETLTVSEPILSRMPKVYEGLFYGMRGFPGGYRENAGLVEPEHVTKLLIFVADPQMPHRFMIDNIRLTGSPITAPLPTELSGDFFPMIDQFGQYKHNDWPGKTHSVEDLKRYHEEEIADLEQNPGGANRDQYGGWANGPKLEATGHFRTAKRDGRWWLVDPEGRLFWSHGVDCVRVGNATTPITDREHYFESLPEVDSSFARFYGSGNWAPHGYYEGRGKYRTYAFDSANLLRKHGEQWEPIHAELVHRRLQSWEMNTIANWSDSKIFKLQKTPYTATIHFSSPVIEGSEGYWGKFPDPFDSAFQNGIHYAAKQQAGWIGDDPWCIGIFVHNELDWRTNTSLARAALLSPGDQPAKLALLAELKQRYTTVDSLNATWQTDYKSWDALRETTTVPDDTPAMVNDLEAFYTTLAEQYFRVIHDELESFMPNRLYFGCRFSNDNDLAVQAAGKYCDVISFNRYRYSVADLALPEGVDRPVVIGEFHFGALDRGMFHTGLRATANQDARSQAYADYVSGALKNPLIVGTHWFQYRDQATTGRGDGENYQIGFLDCCDTPYPEIIAAARRVGRSMYETRSGETGE